MNWLRSRTRGLSGLALFALALQFALAFGHFHPIQPGAAELEISASLEFAKSSDQKASDQKSDDQLADYCDICAITALAHATVICAVVTLLLPDLLQGVRLQNGTPFRLVEVRRLAFQSRAPPQSPLNG